MLYRTVVLLLAVLAVRSGLACQVPRSVAILLDGINVSTTPQLLASLADPVAMAVSLNDLRTLPAVLLIAKQALVQGHVIVMRWQGELPTGPGWPLEMRTHVTEFRQLLGANAGATYVLPSREPSWSLANELLDLNIRVIGYTLDISPDYIHDAPRFIRDTVPASASVGYTVYVNSFLGGANEKASGAAAAFKGIGYAVVPLSRCYY
jgi:hypothetical protein